MLVHGKPPRIRGWVSARLRNHLRPQPRYARLVTHMLSLHAAAGEDVPALVSVSVTRATVRADARKGEVVVQAASGRKVAFVVKKEWQWKTWVEGLRIAGAVVTDYYEVGVGRGVIGKGAFSEVFEGRDRDTGESVAVKVMDKVKCGPVEREHATCEARVLSFATHPGMVKCLDIFDGAGELVVVMENMKGGTLEESVGRVRAASRTWVERGSSGGMPRVFKMIIGRLLGALAYMHENGVVHRDVKPDNILVGDVVSDAAWAETAVVSDFGLAAYIEGGEELSEIVGTPEFLAPEVLRRGEDGARLGYGPQVDIWAAGIVLWWLLTGGRTPFGDEPDGGPHMRVRTATGSTDVGMEFVEETGDTLDTLGDIVMEGTEKSLDGSTREMDAIARNDEDISSSAVTDVERQDPSIVFKKIRSVPDTPLPLDDPAFHYLGDDAKSLLRGLLNPLPARRLSALGALSHPIFAGLDLSVPFTARPGAPGSPAASDLRRPVSTDADKRPPGASTSRSSSSGGDKSGGGASAKGVSSKDAKKGAQSSEGGEPSQRKPISASARKFRALANAVIAHARLMELLKPKERRRRVTFGAQPSRAGTTKRRSRPPPIAPAPVGVDGIRYNVGLFPMPRPVPSRPRAGSTDGADPRKARVTAQAAAEAAAKGEEERRKKDAEAAAVKAAAAKAAAAKAAATKASVAKAAAAKSSDEDGSGSGSRISGWKKRQVVRRQGFALGRNGGARLVRSLSTNGEGVKGEG